MKIILSPAKKIDTKGPFPTFNYNSPEHLDRSLELVKKLKKLNASQLQELMKVSESIAKLNCSRFREFSLPFNRGNAYPAAYLFKGETYMGLNMESLSVSEHKYANQKVRILSGLYGMLAPMDLIQPYRLEMGTRFVPNKEAKNLYQFWKEELTGALKREMSKGEYLINLASNEYFKVLDADKFNVITPVFKKKKDGIFKTVGMMSKRARGMMANYIIKNKIEDIEELKDFPHYKYSKKLSSEQEWVFVAP